MSLSQRLQTLHQQVPAPWLFALLLTLCFFVFFLQETEVQPIYDTDTKRFPQVFMLQVETREFDETGKLHYQLITPKISHFQIDLNGPSSQDYTLINSPIMAFYAENSDAPWQVSAKTGRSEGNGELIRLLDDVVIEQDTPNQGVIEIATSELRIHPSQQFAETDKAVKLRSAKGQVDAIGMDADLAQSRLQLKSQVKAVYEPR